MFKKKCPEPQKLPPTRDALLCHLKRANYATAVVKCALEQFPNIPGPDGHGWIVEEGILQVQWMLRNPIPDDLIEFISCNCKKSKCMNKQCICISHGLNCTDMCNCNDCDNGSSFDVNNNFQDSDVETEDSNSCDDFEENDSCSEVDSSDDESNSED